MAAYFFKRAPVMSRGFLIKPHNHLGYDPGSRKDRNHYDNGP
jgi:hypothetical protein